MTHRPRILILILALLSLPLSTTGCNKTETGEQTTTPEPSSNEGPTVDAPADAGGERAKLSRTECEAQGGQVVGDIGDGAIHRPDYVCASGKPPLATIAPADDEPIAAEGEVCCPAG